MSVQRLKDLVYTVNPLVTGSVMGVLTVAQYILTFFYHQPGLQALRVVGYLLWTLAAIFGILPIITFRRKGGVRRGDSYIKTTVLVDSGIYALVRHPQYLAGIFTNLGCMLVAQHWLIVFLGIPSIVLITLDAHRADESLFEKFGEGYRRYADRVPRLNVVAGALRLLQDRRKGVL